METIPRAPVVLGALVQKCGYLGAADPNTRDFDLILRLAAVSAKAGFYGVAGLDEDNGVKMSVIALFVSRKGSHSTQDTGFEELHNVENDAFSVIFCVFLCFLIFSGF